MIQPLLKDIYTWDGGELPIDNGESFFTPMVAEIGENNTPGVDLFYFGICNSKWLENEINHENFKNIAEVLFVDGRTICLNNVNIPHIKKAVNQVIDFVLPVNTWEEFGNRIDPYLNWEFFDYKISK